MHAKFYLSTALSVGLVLAVSLVVLQRVKIHSLQRNLEEMRAKGNLQEGALAPPIKAMAFNGRAETIRFGTDSRPTLLYVFSPDCPWCASNTSAIDQLASKVRGRYDVIGISLKDEGLGPFLANHPLTFPVYKGISEETRNVYRLATTPETIVVSPEARVTANWNGAYLGATERLVEDYFSVQLHF